MATKLDQMRLDQDIFDRMEKVVDNFFGSRRFTVYRPDTVDVRRNPQSLREFLDLCAKSLGCMATLLDVIDYLDIVGVEINDDVYIAVRMRYDSPLESTTGHLNLQLAMETIDVASSFVELDEIRDFVLLRANSNEFFLLFEVAGNRLITAL